MLPWLMMIPCVFVILVLTAIVVYETVKKRRVIDVKTKRPSQKQLGVITSLLDRALLGNRIVHDMLLERAREFDFKPYMSFFGPVHTLNLASAEELKKLLLHLDKFPKIMLFNNPWMEIYGCDNVVFVNGEHWENARRIINPAFVRSEAFWDTFMQKSMSCIQILKQKSDDLITVPDFTTRLSLDVLGETSFGYEFNYLQGIVTGSQDPHIDAYRNVMDNIFSLPAILLGKAFTSLPTERNKKMAQSLKLLDDLFYRLIAQSREKLKRADDTQLSKTLLDLMIENNIENKLSDKELKDNLSTFLVAGQDTTASALAFALYNIAKYPEVHEKLMEEIDREIGIESGLTIESISKCEYLSMFLNENMRMYPPVPILFPRIAHKSETFGDLKIAKGTIISPSIYALHYNPEYWPEPEVFRPERFSSEERKNRHQFAFCPFGAGPRLCIGNHFSLLMQKIFLISLLQTFTVELPDKNYDIKKHWKGEGTILAPPDNFQLLFKPIGKN